ncbi:MAG: hypothetical protein KHZ85_01940 [Amedibacillus dolichus]|uniref:Uncharacterized protein n=1 Tax=Amedibacillus dolichus TaxID=31971 RepID=A0A942WF73_9FIRM|nr:hypothetical protein [Amedibacillus dolichus]MBS4883506.1 hypothetical protein [Amedibacillus dolichus]MEE0383052.1 hypothetical protein [Amedibacillus dolichus]
MEEKKSIEISSEEETILCFYRKLDRLKQQKFLKFLESLRRVLIDEDHDVLA